MKEPESGRNEKLSPIVRGEKSYAAMSLVELLKNPAGVIRRIEEEDNLWQRGLVLAIGGLVFHGLYGLAMALFGGWEAGLMTLAKAPLITFFSMGLCLPSLYVFSAIGGRPISIKQSFAIASGAMAVIGLLLLGLVPVTWLFSVSTRSLPFVVVLNVLAWLFAVSFARRFLRMLESSGARKTRGLQWWLIIYIVVSLQMATTMRPLLEIKKDGWWTSGKKSFLIHFAECFKSNEKKEARAK